MSERSLSEQGGLARSALLAAASEEEPGPLAALGCLSCVSGPGLGSGPEVDTGTEPATGNQHVGNMWKMVPEESTFWGVAVGRVAGVELYLTPVVGER